MATDQPNRLIPHPPEILPEISDFLSAFWALTTDRPFSTTAGPIPYTSIDRWANRFGIDDPDDFDMFLWAIRVMDNEWMSCQKADGPMTPEEAASKLKPMSAQVFDSVFTPNRG